MNHGVEIKNGMRIGFDTHPSAVEDMAAMQLVGFDANFSGGKVHSSILLQAFVG